MSTMKIGEVAKRTGVAIETIRFYERQGLLLQPTRRASGYRQFDESAVARLTFILRSKDLGFTLAEIKELLGLWFDPSSTCCEVRKRAEDKILEIEGKLRSLQSMKRSLRRLIDQCQQRSTKTDCPLLLGLDG